MLIQVDKVGMPNRSLCRAFLWLIFCSVLLISGQSFAVQPPIFSNPYVRRFNYGFTGLFGKGDMGTEDSTIPQRPMDFTTYQGFLGFRIDKYRYSVWGEWSYVAQKVEADVVNNSNLGGQGYAWGPKFEYYDGRQSFGIMYRAKSTYRLNKMDANNNRQYYGAKTGFGVQWTHRVSHKWGIVVDYAREEYGKSLTNRVSWDRVSVGFIFSNFDKPPFPLPDNN